MVTLINSGYRGHYTWNYSFFKLSSTSVSDPGAALMHHCTSTALYLPVLVSRDLST